MDISTCVRISDNSGKEEYDPLFPWETDESYGSQGSFGGGFACEADVEDEEELDALTPHELGREGERLAASYLAARGYTIIERNWRCREGEVDIICRDEDGTYVLVEVKSRQARGAEAYLMPELNVDEQKQHKLARLALWYLVENPTAHSVRFDVIAVSITGHSSARIRHLVGAFAWDE